MTETDDDWAELDEAPAKKRGIPKWVWGGCGCGCALVVILLAVGGFWLKDVIEQGTDPEVQWPKLQRVLPYDERPTDLAMEMGITIPLAGVENYTLIDHQRGYVATVQHHLRASANEMAVLFDAEGGAMPFGLGEPVDAEAAEVVVQGNPVRALFYRTIGGQGSMENLGPGVRIDATQGAGFTLVDLRLMKKEVERVPDEVIEEFFDHFDLWGE